MQHKNKDLSLQLQPWKVEPIDQKKKKKKRLWKCYSSIVTLQLLLTVMSLVLGNKVADFTCALISQCGMKLSPRSGIADKRIQVYQISVNSKEVALSCLKFQNLSLR